MDWLSSYLLMIAILLFGMLAGLNIAAMLIVHGSAHFTRGQKRTEILRIWALPIVGAVAARTACRAQSRRDSEEHRP